MKGLSENESLVAQYWQVLSKYVEVFVAKLIGLRENDEQLVQKSKGLYENDELLEEKV